MGDGLIINGRNVPVPGVRVVTWEDDPRVPRAVHGAPRAASKVTASIAHTSRGVDAQITRATGSSAKGLRVARYLGRANARKVSAHAIVAADGTIYQLADLATWRCNHAGMANGFTFGVEVSQDDDDPSLTRAQVAAFVALMHAAHDALGVPKRVPMVGGHHVYADVRAWLSKKSGGEQRAFTGCSGHRCTSASRGKGDPGDALMEALRASGFAPATPAEMTVSAAPLAAVEADDEADELHDGDDAHAWPPLPAWIDASREVDASADLPDDLAAFVRAQVAELAALGIMGERAFEVIAHCATECGRGRRAIGHNLGGVRLRQADDAEYRAKHGHGLAWWRDLGHVESGDPDVAYYRAFDDASEFWRFWLKRYVPLDAAAGDRYAETGRAFHGWSPTPAQWFVELLLAGYRGEVRQREVAALVAAGRDPELHPSIAAHRRIVARVAALAGGAP